jgi:signal transduction histidine kinase
MRKKLIPLLGAATAVAAFCLVGFQLFWISEARKIKEDEFNNLVNSALDHLVIKMEKDEVYFQIVNDISPKQGYSFTNSKSGVRSFQKEQQEFTVNLFDTTSIDKKFSPIGDPAIANVLYNTLLEIDKQERAQKQPSEKVKVDERLNYKKVLVDNIVEKIVTVEIPIEQRISEEKLDSIISKEFNNRGIDTRYTYAVRHANGELLFGSDKVDLESSSNVYVRQLFPNDLLSEQYYLSISFPRKQGYIFKTMGATLFTSIALLIIVLGVFLSTLITIVRQKKLSQVRSDFVSNMTHELKTPIATISLASEMLNDPNVPNEKKNYEYLSNMIKVQSKRLSFLVERVLQLAMFESGRMRLNKQRVEFHVLADKVLDGFVLQADSKGASIARAYNATNDDIVVDEVHFTNILGNLVDNALKYSKEDPIVVVSTKNQDGKLLIQVRDNGIGIEKDDQKRVFDQFYRVHTGNLHNVKGFGLGLSYVKKIVDEHDGDIWIESEQGKGTVFNILMPLAAKN